MQTEVVDRARRGDHEAFSVLAGGAVDRLYGMARLILRDTELAENATQEALVRAWRDLPTLRDAERFDAWLYRLLVNACADIGRHRRRWRSELTVVSIEPAEPDRASELADRDQLERGLRRLSDAQSTILILHFYVALAVVRRRARTHRLAECHPDGAMFGPAAFAGPNVRSNAGRTALNVAVGGGYGGSMKAVVVYESHWGNTAAIAQAIADGIGSGARALNTDEATREALAEVDLIVAGSPVIAFALPRDGSLNQIAKDEKAPVPPDTSHPLLRTWLDKLPVGHGFAAAFETRIWWSLRGATGTIESKLRESGYERLLPGERFTVAGGYGPLRAGELERANRWGAELAAALSKQLVPA